MDDLGVPPFQETPIFYKIVNGIYKHFETKPHFLGWQRCRFRLEPHAGKWAGFTCAPAEGLDVDVSVVERDGMWCQILAGRAVTVRFRSPSCNATLPWRWAAGSVGMSWNKTQDLQSICPTESGNINTTGTFTTIYTTGSFCWFVFPRPMHVQSLSLSLLRMHMSYVFSPKPLHNEPCGKQWLSMVSWLEHE